MRQADLAEPGRRARLKPASSQEGGGPTPPVGTVEATPVGVPPEASQRPTRVRHPWASRFPIAVQSVGVVLRKSHPGVLAGVSQVALPLLPTWGNW